MLLEEIILVDDNNLDVSVGEELKVLQKVSRSKYNLVQIATVVTFCESGYSQAGYTQNLNPGSLGSNPPWGNLPYMTP